MPEHENISINSACVFPGRSRATRAISRRSKGAGRAVLVGGRVPRQILCESLLEHRAATILLARRDVADIWDQPPAVTYEDETGRHKHTFDFLVELHDGRRIAIAVRPEHRAHDLRKTVTTIAAQIRDFADEFLVLTDAQLTPNRLHNATTILMARRGANPNADAKMHEIVRTLHGATTIEMLANTAGFDGEGYRAAVRLLDTGELELMRGVTRIGLKAMVQRATIGG